MSLLTPIAELYQSLSNYMPNILVALIILLIGFLIGKMIKYAVKKFSEIFGLGKITQKTGIDSTLKNLGYAGNTFDLIGDILKWGIYIVFIIAIAKVLFGEQLSTQFLIPILKFLPRIVVAILIIITGFIISDVLSNIAKNLTLTISEKWKEKRVISSIVGIFIKVLIFLIALTISLDLLGIYVEIFTISFAIMFFSIIILIIVGGKDLLLNIFAGLYLQSLENFHKGAKVEINGSKGELIKVGLVHSTIKIGKKEILIPNYLFLKEKFSVE